MVIYYCLDLEFHLSREKLGIQKELRPLTDIILRPHNSAAKVYSWYGLAPDLRFGSGCLHKAFGVQYIMPYSTILYDPRNLHFATVLEDGSYFDPAWGQITLPVKGIAHTLQEGITMEIERYDADLFVVQHVSDGYYSRKYTMSPYYGSFDHALSLLMQDSKVVNRFALTWYENPEFERLDYSPFNDCLYYVYASDDRDNGSWIERAAECCQASPEELLDYFRTAHQLLYS